jgi:hypothetical protein
MGYNQQRATSKANPARSKNFATALNAVAGMRTTRKRSMPKANSKPETNLAYTIQPWSCVHENGKSQIEAYVMATGKHEMIAETFPTSDNSAEAVAELIVKAINMYDKRERLIEEMVAALEICLECEGLNSVAAHDAAIVLYRSKRKI